MSVDVCRGEADGQSEQLRSQRTLSAQRAEQLRAQLRDQPGDFGGNRGMLWNAVPQHGIAQRCTALECHGFHM